jgi:hypothetical protein
MTAAQFLKRLQGHALHSRAIGNKKLQFEVSPVLCDHAKELPNAAHSVTVYHRTGETPEYYVIESVEATVDGVRFYFIGGSRDASEEEIRRFQESQPYQHKTEFESATV